MTHHPEHPRPAARGADGERAAWLVPTAVLRGLGGLLVLAGGGAATAASLSVEQQQVDTTVTEAVDTVVVEAPEDRPCLHVSSAVGAAELSYGGRATAPDGRQRTGQTGQRRQRRLRRREHGRAAPRGAGHQLRGPVRGMVGGRRASAPPPAG